MKTLPEIAALLRARLKDMPLTQQELGAEAGLARRTLSGMLSGRADYKVTTLMAVLDRLGLDLVIVPKAAARGVLQQAEPLPASAQPAVKTRVQAAREAARARLGAARSAEEPS